MFFEESFEKTRADLVKTTEKYYPKFKPKEGFYDWMATQLCCRDIFLENRWYIEAGECETLDDLDIFNINKNDVQIIEKD